MAPQGRPKEGRITSATSIAEGVVHVDEFVQPLCFTGTGIDVVETAAQCADPDMAVGSIRERGDHGFAREPIRVHRAQLPAVRVPAIDAAGARADPHEARIVFVEGHDEGVGERVRIGIVVAIMRDAMGSVGQMV